jgi:hypothetical protein
VGPVYEHKAYPNHTASLLYSSLVLSLTMGPTGQETHLPLLQRIILLLLQFFNRKQIKNGKELKRRRNFANNISLESSRRGESIEAIDF